MFRPACLFLMVFIASASANAAPSGPVIDIYVPEKVVHSIAIPQFATPKGQPDPTGLRLADAVAADLGFTGLFRLIDREAYLEKPGQVPVSGAGTRWEDWRVLKTSLLVRGSTEVRGNKVSVEVRAFQVATGKSIGGKKISGRTDDLTRLGHLVADQVYKLLTGEGSFFNSQIAFINNRTGNKELYVARFDGTQERAVTRNRSINLSPSWSPDGTKLVFTSYVRKNPDLYIYNTGDGKFFRLSNRSGINIGAEWSPRGRVLATTLSMKRGNPEVYLLNEDGTGPRNMTRKFGNDVSPTWSPDARRIAFVSDRSGNPNIYVQDPFGKTAKRLTFKAKDNQSPSWSPRGDRIVWAAQVSGRWQIFTMKPDGSDQRQITAWQGNTEDPVWSPDGRLILVTASRSGRRHLWVVDADGSNPRQVTRGKGKYTNPAWSPQGAW